MLENTGDVDDVDLVACLIHAANARQSTLVRRVTQRSDGADVRSKLARNGHGTDYR